MARCKHPNGIKESGTCKRVCSDCNRTFERHRYTKLTIPKGKSRQDAVQNCKDCSTVLMPHALSGFFSI